MNDFCLFVRYCVESLLSVGDRPFASSIGS
jgi:hypothetical protein